MAEGEGQGPKRCVVVLSGKRKSGKDFFADLLQKRWAKMSEGRKWKKKHENLSSVKGVMYGVSCLTFTWMQIAIIAEHGIVLVWAVIRATVKEIARSLVAHV